VTGAESGSKINGQSTELVKASLVHEWQMKREGIRSETAMSALPKRMENYGLKNAPKEVSPKSSPKP